MLDEFPALGRLDFFESALAFMAGYGLRAFLIAQSFNQIEKAYGPNNSILDNCHVRVAFATNDERTAKRISDALGTATELRAQRNYAGHRLSPWLGHLMVSRQETARALLTPGEVMQLPPDDEIVMVSGQPPVRAKKLRYFEDRNFTERLLPPPSPSAAGTCDSPPPRPDDWPAALPLPNCHQVSRTAAIAGAEDGGGGLSRAEAPRTRSSPNRDRRRLKDSSLSTPTSTRRPGSSSSPSPPSSVPRGSRRSIPRTGAAMSRARLNVYLELRMRSASTELATMRGLSKSGIVAAALASFFSPDGADQREAAIARRLDRLTHQFDRLERDQTILIETVALFIRHYLSVSTPVPERTRRRRAPRAGRASSSSSSSSAGTCSAARVSLAG